MYDRARELPPIEKILGADFELGNSLVDARQRHHLPGEAAQLLLQAVPGYPLHPASRGTAIELGRVFLPSGSSRYEDLEHFEWNVPECRSASEHALYLHAGLRWAQRARQLVNARLPRGQHVEVFANNGDGQDHISYGAHKNVLCTAECWHDLCDPRKPQLGTFLATHLVTSALYSGQGTVGARNGRDACDYQLSQRCDAFERMWDVNTMQHRPLINTRNEPHAGEGMARLHVIYHDLTLAPVSNRLTAGALQAVVALCEAGIVDPSLTLGDPVAAASQISRDLGLQQKLATVVRGRKLTALEIQQGIRDLVAGCHAEGLLRDAVPEIESILRDWQTSLDLLQQRDVEALAARHDNWLKYLLLDRHRARRNLRWDTAEMRMLDMQYANLDPEQGLFLKMAAAGAVAELPDEADLERAMHQPPRDTRAWLRGELLRRFGQYVSSMDWSWITFRIPVARGWTQVARVSMPDPRRFGQDECADILALDSLEAIVTALNERSAPLAGTSLTATRIQTTSWQ
ncbi:MAG: proteasome accessory factor PafA2 family protein [Pirellulales bacterium]|nr:proteasome accessory factor PafA2 family protein [Pirellulales bacterium]